MTLPGRVDRTAVLLWFGLAGAPVAWTLQHIIGYGLTEASCQEAGQADWHLPLDAWTIVVTGAALVVGLASCAAAIATMRLTRDAGTEPPGARIRFLATVAVTTGPLFVTIMLMSGLGTLFTTACRQSRGSAAPSLCCSR
jgi:hypothetical protein